ncbi:MAG: ATP-binding protein [Verrucomicrobiae bacterium]|nr:ATP-binding protein [Verrucomicrobiae bacterium]
MTLFPRALRLPRESFFLLGPRGTGKSTWLRTVRTDARWVDLLREEVFQRLLVAPERFADELRPLPRGSWVIVDEIQRLPSLLHEVHRVIEEQGLRFCLCGSSARKLRRAGVNLLGGRALKRAMHPLLPEEMGAAFDLESTLRHGTLPVILASEEREERLGAYAQLYLKEEVQAEALVRNLPGFARFLPIAALYHGQSLNVANIAREAGVARTTVNGYLEILEETLLCFRVEAHEARLRVRERKHPKWYWCDPGLARAMKGGRGPLAIEERGALFEGWVAQTLRAYRDYRGAFEDFSCWAPTESREVEVDFLLRRGAHFVAVEAKAGARFQENWCAGLRTIAPLRGLKRRIVVCPHGPSMCLRDGIEVVPALEFARMLSQNALFP